MTSDRPAERNVVRKSLRRHVGLYDAVGRRLRLEPQAIRVALLRGHPAFGSSQTKTGQPSAYARNSRPSDGADPPDAVYIYAANRKGGRPITHLAGFAGIL